MAAAIITGGVLAGMGMPPTGLSEVGSGAKDFLVVLQRNLQAQVATALIQSVVNGADLQDSLQQALINSVGAKVADGIGTLKVNGVLDSVTHKMAHAIAGCALGAAKAGDKGGCAPGAIGAVVGELMAEAMGQSPEIQSLLGGKNEQVYVAGLFASLAGAMTGGTPEDIAIANWAGANAAANNAIPHSPSDKAKQLGAQENARLTAACEPNCTQEDYRRIDQQVTKVTFAATMMEQAQKGGLSQSSAEKLAQTLIELAPIYGTGESVLQLITGRSSLTGEEASRFWAAVGLVPIGGGVLRKVGEPTVEALVTLFKGGEAIKGAAEVADVARAANAAEAARLRGELDELSKVAVDTSRDAQYIAQTDRALLSQYNFDMDHVLVGEINARGNATGYHAEAAADGASRIAPGATITYNANGTYEAPVQIWDAATGAWVDKKNISTFFPPSWSAARIEYEVTQAFKGVQPQTRALGTSPSGITIQFNWDPKNQRTTFYPIK